MKLAHQLADETVDRSEVDKYHNEFCKDMTKPFEIARPAPAAKTGDDCEVKMPQKMIKPPDASQTYLVEPRGSGKANLLDVLQSHMCAAMPAFPRRLRSPRRIPLGTPPSMVLLPDLRPQTQRREEPTEGTPRKRSRSRSGSLLCQAHQFD